eukprot:scaffold33904_cov157-Isochrysis_galbana.AAC.3
MSVLTRGELYLCTYARARSEPWLYPMMLNPSRSWSSARMAEASSSSCQLIGRTTESTIPLPISTLSTWACRPSAVRTHISTRYMLSTQSKIPWTSTTGSGRAATLAATTVPLTPRAASRPPTTPILPRMPVPSSPVWELSESELSFAHGDLMRLPTWGLDVDPLPRLTPDANTIVARGEGPTSRAVDHTPCTCCPRITSSASVVAARKRPPMPATPYSIHMKKILK